MSKKYIWIITMTVVILLIGAWYFFRPEKLFIDETVNESLPTTQTPPTQNHDEQNKPESQTLYQGEFVDGDQNHKGKGIASIIQLENGKKVLRFTSFETDNGPDVKIYLVALPKINTSEEVTKENSISLGKMKGNIGDQNYELSDNIDLDKYQSVSIWCERFSVNFAAASLKKSS